MPARHGARGGTRRDASPGVSLRAPKVKGGRWPPFHTFPPITRAANGVRCHQSFARSAKRRPHQVAYRPGAPASSPGGGLRPASRGSAKPAPTTLRPANLTAANGVSPICVESRGRLVERRPPVGTRGSAKPAPMTVRRTDVSGAPPAQSGLRCSLRFAQRCRPPPGGLARGRRSLASASWCPWGYPPRCVARRLAPRPEGERGESPLSHIPPGHAGSERSSLPLFLRAQQYANHAESRGHGAPVSDRHRWSAGLRPASRGSAKPAPTTPPPTNLTAANGVSPICAESRGHGAPVSDRHRAAARNPHQQRCALPISLLRTAYRRSAQNRGDLERRPVLPVGASDRHRAGARNPHQQRCAVPT